VKLATFRFYLAAVMVAVTPSTALEWAQLHLSGYTFNDDGTRDLGHLAKAAGLVPLVVASVAVVVVACGLVTIWWARRAGGVTLPRLAGFAAAVGGIAGFGVSFVLEFASNPSALLPPFVAGAAVALASAVVGILLSLEFSLVAAVPIRQTTSDGSERPFPQSRGVAVVVAACVMTSAAIIWLSFLTGYSVLHPCDCG
jgi:hypothetical protein